MEDLMGGKPSKGTPADKRLAANRARKPAAPRPAGGAGGGGQRPAPRPPGKGRKK